VCYSGRIVMKQNKGLGAKCVGGYHSEGTRGGQSYL